MARVGVLGELLLDIRPDPPHRGLLDHDACCMIRCADIGSSGRPRVLTGSRPEVTANGEVVDLCAVL